MISSRSKNFYKEQLWYAKNVIEPFLNLENKKNLKILEVGTAEGGVLRYLYQKNHTCYGIECSKSRFETSIKLGVGLDIKFTLGDITDTDTFDGALLEKMDIVICHDVFEHIPNDKKVIALKNMAGFVKITGKLFITFPPKYSPFAGHQQNISNKLGKIPYLFLLPNKLYVLCLKKLGVSENSIKNLLNTKHKRLSIADFEKKIKEVELLILKKDYYLFRPSFEHRFGIKRKKLSFSNSSYLREFFTLGVIYLLKNDKKRG